MKTPQHIKEAIEGLTVEDRIHLKKWIYAHAFVEEENPDIVDRVAEPAVAYKASPERHHLSVEEYRRLEADSPLRHEYVAGEIFAMAGVSLRHNRIAGNVFSAISSHLSGSPCAAFIADVKVRIKVGWDDFFYYPDVMVACGHQELDRRELDDPKLIIEVLSPSTERADRWEKALNYRQIPALQEHVLIAQSTLEITIHRRSEDWAPQSLIALDAVAQFQSIDLSVPLARIYENTL